MGWREGCESVLNVGTPCNISTAALPAAAHPPFPSAIPLSFLCLESLFLHTHGLCGSPPHSHSGLAPPPSQPGGFDVSLGWRFGHGVAQATGSPSPPSPKQGPRGCRMRFGQRGRGPAGWGAGQGCQVTPPVSSQVRALLLARWRMMGMGQADRRYSCPASD